MAIIKLNYLSKALLRTVDVTVVLPTDTLDMDTMTYNQKKEYKTLYLLHGIFGDHSLFLIEKKILLLLVFQWEAMVLLSMV